MAQLTIGSAFQVSMDDIDLTLLLGGTIVTANATTYAVQLNSGEIISFVGTGFTYNALFTPTGGTVTRVVETYQGQTVYDLTGLHTSATDLVTWAATGDNAGAVHAMLGGADTINGAGGDDLLAAYGGDDVMFGFGGADGLLGGAGNDTVSGGLGNDTIVDESGSNYLRGDEGDDAIVGGTGFDDINGNMGNDTEGGGLGNDWVVGGRDSDMLFGQEGDDIVYGNLGDDSCSGGVGADLIRGGQGDDVMLGEDGNDWMSGDRGNDTLTGGAGADVFHTFGDAGIDRVTDFFVAEGDRVQLDAGTSYTVSQVGADTVINMVGGGQMVLVGVQMSSLGTGWIFGA